jgi:hypothetical protein
MLMAVEVVIGVPTCYEVFASAAVQSIGAVSSTSYNCVCIKDFAPISIFHVLHTHSKIEKILQDMQRVEFFLVHQDLGSDK